MRVCYPYARINDVVDRINRKIEVTNFNSIVMCM